MYTPIYIMGGVVIRFSIYRISCFSIENRFDYIISYERKLVHEEIYQSIFTRGVCCQRQEESLAIL